MRFPEEGDIYQHYKGEYYQIRCIGDFIPVDKSEQYLVNCVLYEPLVQKAGNQRFFLRRTLEFLQNINMLHVEFIRQQKELCLSSVKIENILKIPVGTLEGYLATFLEFDLEVMENLGMLGFDTVKLLEFSGHHSSQPRFTFITSELKVEDLEKFKKEYQIN